MPSVFVWPDVVSGFAPPWQPTVIYPARGVGGLWREPAAKTADALVRLLGANRAAILSGLEEPATTTALAARHRLAPSSVSAHLAVLRDAGLLGSRRQGHRCCTSAPRSGWPWWAEARRAPPGRGPEGA